MNVVVNISEKDIDFVRKNFKPKGYSFIPTQIQTEFVSAILNGTPLPKGHGDLVDRDAVYHAYDYSDIGYTMINALEDAPTIIEADKEAEK